MKGKININITSNKKIIKHNDAIRIIKNNELFVKSALAEYYFKIIVIDSEYCKLNFIEKFGVYKKNELKFRI